MNQVEAGQVDNGIDEIVERWKARIEFCREWIKELRSELTLEMNGEFCENTEKIEAFRKAAAEAGAFFVPLSAKEQFANMDKIFQLEEEISTKEHLIAQREKQKEQIAKTQAEVKRALTEEFPALLSGLRLKSMNATDRKVLDGIVERSRTLGISDGVKFQDYVHCKSLAQKYPK